MVGCNLIIPGGTRVIDATSMLVMPGNILKKLFKRNSYYLAVNSLYISIYVYNLLVYDLPLLLDFGVKVLKCDLINVKKY